MSRFLKLGIKICRRFEKRNYCISFLEFCPPICMTPLWSLTALETGTRIWVAHDPQNIHLHLCSSPWVPTPSPCVPKSFPQSPPKNVDPWTSVVALCICVILCVSLTPHNVPSKFPTIPTQRVGCCKLLFVEVTFGFCMWRGSWYRMSDLQSVRRIQMNSVSLYGLAFFRVAAGITWWKVPVGRS